MIPNRYSPERLGKHMRSTTTPLGRHDRCAGAEVHLRFFPRRAFHSPKRQRSLARDQVAHIALRVVDRDSFVAQVLLNATRRQPSLMLSYDRVMVRACTDWLDHARYANRSARPWRVLNLLSRAGRLAGFGSHDLRRRYFPTIPRSTPSSRAMRRADHCCACVTVKATTSAYA